MKRSSYEAWTWLLAFLIAAVIAIAAGVIDGWLGKADARTARTVTDVGDIVILRHTYDGPELIDGRLLDWQYGYDGMQIELRDRGDGIFRHDFEEPSCRP